MFHINQEEKLQPPRLIPSLVAGFNAVASHVYIIIFPVILDLLLWFGPLVRIKEFFLPALLQVTELSASAYGEDAGEFIAASKQLWTDMLSHYNILSGLRTYPVGVPSLLVSRGGIQNPLGWMQVIELRDASEVLLLTIGLYILGLLVGCLYFALTARIIQREGGKFEIGRFTRQLVQILLLSLLLLVAVLFLGMPLFCLVTSLLMVLPSLGTIPFFLFGLVMVWVLLPIVFSPHGIFLQDLKTAKAIGASVRLARSQMASIGLFFTVIILLGNALDALWHTPGDESWMLLVGIFGHAFISSGSLAASFIFYKKGMEWLMSKVKDEQLQASLTAK